MSEALATTLDCALIAIRLRCKRSAIDLLRHALSLSNRENNYAVRARIMRAISFARRIP